MPKKNKDDRVAKSVSTGCKALDQMMGGKGVPMGSPMGIYGLFNIGKSVLSTQIATRFAAEGYDVIYIDTEAFYQLDEDWDRIYGWFENRWDLDSDVESRIHRVQRRDIFQLGRYFGIEFQITQENARVSAMAKFPKRWTKKDTKRTNQSASWIKYADIYKELEGYDNPGLIVMDSITVPIKSKIASVTQNFPARSSMIQTLLDTTLVLTREFNIGMVITNHGVKNPMGYGVNPWGGGDMIYFIKRWIGLLNGLKADRDTYGEQYRRAYRYRWPGYMNAVSGALIKKDTGYVDLDEAEGSISL